MTFARQPAVGRRLVDEVHLHIGPVERTSATVAVNTCGELCEAGDDPLTALERSMELPRYGTPNIAYVSTWFGAPDDHPMWALNLMKYRAVAEYADGRESSISGADADMLYHPTGPLAAVGAGVRLVTEVTHQLSGDSILWDRVAVAWYPSRMAMLEMQTLPEFQELHAHKDAGMEFTIVMVTTPSADTAEPYDWSSLGDDDLMLVQVVGRGGRLSTERLEER